MHKSLNRFINQILEGDAQQLLKQLPDECIDCVVTSPPYWALRDYGVEGQIGLEASFDDYVQRLCNTFDEVKRVLKTTGTCWVNLGDTYSTRSKKGLWSMYLKTKRAEGTIGSHSPERPYTGLPAKCLLQIPSRFAIEMINRGWVLRNEIIWHKPNCMPSSAKDRFTIDFEKVFFFVKSQKYYFKQQFEQLRDRERLMRRYYNPSTKKKRGYGDILISSINPKTAKASQVRILSTGRNKRCVWPIATRPFRGNHYAVFPPELIKAPIQSGCPSRGTVLDPFIGSGTTAIVARDLGRNFIGIELNAEYVQMARKRVAQQTLC